MVGRKTRKEYLERLTSKPTIKKFCDEGREVYWYDEETGSVKFIHPCSYYLHDRQSNEGVLYDGDGNPTRYYHNGLVYKYTGTETDHQRLQWAEEMVKGGGNH